MSRGTRWWGTAPLAVGATSLLLMAFGARWLPDADAANASARARAEQLEQALQNRQTSKDMSPAERGDALAFALQTVDPRREEEDAASMQEFQNQAPRNGPEPYSEWVAWVGEHFRDEWSDHRDPRGLIAGRIAFYSGLILVFAAGVLLYRRTPDSVYKAW